MELVRTSASTSIRLSLRDPAGVLYRADNRLIRVVRPSFSDDIKTILESPACTYFASHKLLPKTELLQGAKLSEAKALIGAEDWAGEQAAYLEHEALPFPSFPHEWSSEMLGSAASLTLDIAERLLPEGLGLKDATPFNILFRGAEPVFVDILSIEKRNLSDAMWLPYAQFVRSFLTPLLVNRYFRISLSDVFLSRGDGLRPREVYPLVSFFWRLRQPFFSLVTIPTWLEKPGKQMRSVSYEKRLVQKPEKARFILGALLGHLRSLLNKILAKKVALSVWTDYMSSSLPYTKAEFAIKEDFVVRYLKTHLPKTVLDVGCNTGHFSELAAQSGADVVAIDSDGDAIGQLWKRAKEKKLSLLPLVVNLVRPTPAVGWRNRESSSFLDRARGKFDTVLALAVLHHMLYDDRIPLDEVLELFAAITRSDVVIELVGPKDPNVTNLIQTRHSDVQCVDCEIFELKATRLFEILDKQTIPGTERTLYTLRKLNAEKIQPSNRIH